MPSIHSTLRYVREKSSAKSSGLQRFFSFAAGQEWRTRVCSKVQIGTTSNDQVYLTVLTCTQFLIAQCKSTLELLENLQKQRRLNYIIL